MNDEKCSRDAAKTLVIAIINGANYSSATLKQLANELKVWANYEFLFPNKFASKHTS